MWLCILPGNFDLLNFVGVMPLWIRKFPEIYYDQIWNRMCSCACQISSNLRYQYLQTTRSTCEIFLWCAKSSLERPDAWHSTNSYGRFQCRPFIQKRWCNHSTFSAFEQNIKSSTTRKLTCLDHIYTRHLNAQQAGVVPIYYSYHDDIYFCRYATIPVESFYKYIQVLLILSGHCYLQTL